ncbi:hypothetical protein [Rhodoblastus sp.]|uniref:hypothetical protein n=1 Tax=Rhodoblastus sp. TaxID=1962975 RepID=UPI003F95035C
MSLALIHAALTEWALGGAALLCFAAAGAAAVYLPLVGRTLAAFLIALGCGLGAYFFGFRAGAADGDARLAAFAAEYNDQAQKAIIAQQAKDRAEAEAQEKTTRDALEKLAAEDVATKADLADGEAAIDDAAPATDCGGADAAAPALILEAIGKR